MAGPPPVVTNLASLPDAFSAAELAAFDLPGLSRSKRVINRWRDTRGWTVREGERGRLLIPVDQLPAQARDELIERLTARLAPKPAPERRGRGRPKGSDFFTRNPQIADAVLSYVAQNGFASAPQVRALLEADFADLPDVRTLQRFIAKVESERALQLELFRDPDSYKSKRRVALGRADGGVSYAHEVWELDTTKADVMTAGGRKMILGLIDRWSRRVRFTVADSESGQSVRALLAKAISEWGVVPATIVVDNGSGYVNETVKSACALLGIEHRPCPPGSPERKPFVERLFGTFTRQRLNLLEGFTGHNVAQAQQLRGKAKKETGRAAIVASVTPEQLQAYLDNWTTGTYETAIHGSTGVAPLIRAGQSPVAARPAPPPATLRTMLTASLGTMTVGKRGLRWQHGRYWCAELAAWIGKPVHVRRDEADLGALLVFDGEGGFVGTAVNHERAGMSEQAFATEARHHQRALEKAHRAEVRQLKKDFPIERAVNSLLRREAEAAGKLAVLPTPALTPRPQAEPVKATVHRLPPPKRGDDIARRVARAEMILAAIDAGHEVPTADRAWAEAFVEMPAFKAFRATSPATAERNSA